MQETVTLGPRLNCVASYVPEHAKLGDIGTDHAYLPIYLCEQQRMTEAIAVDVHEGPYQSARAAVRSRGLEEMIDVRFGDGLKPIQPGEVDTLTLAGMGGNTMLEIIKARPDVIAQVTTLILQPQGAEGKTRKTLLQSGWFLQDERLVEEEGRIYSVMVYSRHHGKSINELEMLKTGWQQCLVENLQKRPTPEIFPRLCNHLALPEAQEALNRVFWEIGPLILDRPTVELESLIEEHIKPLKQAINEMRKSFKEEIHYKRVHLEITCALLEAMKKCLFPLV